MGCPLHAAGCALKALDAAGQGLGAFGGLNSGWKRCQESGLLLATLLLCSLDHLFKFRATKSSASSLFSGVYLNLQKDTDDTASVGVGKKRGEEKGKFFLVLTDLKA